MVSTSQPPATSPRNIPLSLPIVWNCAIKSTTSTPSPTTSTSPTTPAPSAYLSSPTTPAPSASSSPPTVTQHRCFWGCRWSRLVAGGDGSESICSTQMVCAVGRWQAMTAYKVASIAEKSGVMVIADSGISSFGYIMNASALGVSIVTIEASLLE